MRRAELPDAPELKTRKALKKLRKMAVARLDKAQEDAGSCVLMAVRDLCLCVAMLVSRLDTVRAWGQEPAECKIHAASCCVVWWLISCEGVNEISDERLPTNWVLTPKNFYGPSTAHLVDPAFVPGCNCVGAFVVRRCTVS